jgi:hypothetical protein
MRSAIRLVALDLDGTLVSPGEYIPQTTIDALKRAAQAGILITTASGRDVEQQLPLLERYELGAQRGIPHFLLTNEAHLYLAKNGAYEPWAEHNSPMILAWQRLLPAAIAITQNLVSRLQGEGFEVKRASSDDFAGRRCLIDFTIVGELGAKRAHSLLALAAAGESNELRPNCVQGGADRRAAGRGSPFWLSPGNWAWNPERSWRWATRGTTAICCRPSGASSPRPSRTRMRISKISCAGAMATSRG